MQFNAEQQQKKEQLRSLVINHLVELGYVLTNDGLALEGAHTKPRIRMLYEGTRNANLERQEAFIKRYAPSLLEHFASGHEINPAKVVPELQVVIGKSKNSRLFRLASMLWSVPVSAGYGRRMRFLVRDSNNGKLMGIFALGDPVFNLKARDQWIAWNSEERKARLSHVMDAYVVGAVPPYSLLIGGKLIALLTTSNEVRLEYEHKYANRESIISRSKKFSPLVLVTTSSALGRSSLYNRLRMPDGPMFSRIGATSGYGHFHLSEEVFAALRQHLVEIDHPYASGYSFGGGPNWKIRVVRAALNEIGLGKLNILQHGINREVFAAPLASNWREVLQGKDIKPIDEDWSVRRIGEFCRERWMVPRAQRDSRYLEFGRSSILQLIRGKP